MNPVPTTTDAPTCEYLHELWGPHEGCREFMTEPEAIIRCDEPASAVLVIEFHHPGGSDVDTLFACQEHVKDWDDGWRDQYSKVLGRAELAV